MTDLDPNQLQDDQQFSDDTDSSGGGSEPSPEPQSRRLRDDATSDPMRRQTEPDQQSLDPQTNAQSPSRSAGPASSGSDPQGEPTEDTAPEPSNSPASSGSGPQAVESGSRQDRPSGGASTDQLAEPDSPSQSPSNEQGLDPQEVAGRDTTDGMDSGGAQTPDRTTGPASGGGPAGPTGPGGSMEGPDGGPVQNPGEATPAANVSPSGPTQQQRDEAVGRYIANNPERVDTGAGDPDGGEYTTDEIEVYRTDSGEYVVGPSPEAVAERRQETRQQQPADVDMLQGAAQDARDQSQRERELNALNEAEAEANSRDRQLLEGAAEDYEADARREQETQFVNEQEAANAEQFGDSIVSIPGTNSNVEDVLGGVVSTVSDASRTAGNVAGNTAEAFGVGRENDVISFQDPNFVAPTSQENLDRAASTEVGGVTLTAPVERSPVQVDEGALTERPDTETGRLISGANEGAGSLAAAPAGIALSLKEGAEYGGYASEEISAGRGEQLASDTYNAGAGAAESAAGFVTENPSRAGGIGAGSLIGSGLLFKATANAGRAGTATRYAIQPGEEFAGSAGFRATRRLAGEDAAQRAFPNREPLVFSEEAAIRGARGARSRASDAVDVARREFSGTGRDRAQAGPGFLLRESRSTNAESGRTRSSAESEIDMERLQSNLESFEVAERMRGANERAEQRFLDEQLEAGELQERGDEPRTVDSGVEGGSLSDTRETFTASRAPDTSRSGPTPGQQAAYRSARQSRNTDYSDPLRLSPRESRLAASAQSSPTDDLRDLVSVERRLTGEMERDGFTTAELDAETAVRSGARAPRRRFETALETGATSRMQSDAVGSEVLASVESSELAGEVGTTSPISDTRAAQSPMARVDSDTAQNVATELGQEFETVQGSRSDMLAEPAVSAEAEAGLDTRVGGEFDTRARSELEVETEAELETESRQEFDGFDTRGEGRGDERGLRGRTASAARLNRDLRNPFTGR